MLVLLIIALAGALAFYMYRDVTGEACTARTIATVAPCDPDDHERQPTATAEGTFCLPHDPTDLIEATLANQQVWEPDIVAQFRALVHPGDVVVDAGAYIGEHTIQLAHLVGPTGKVIAFEPQLRVYQQLLVNLDLNHVDNVRAEFAALGDRDARVSMNAARASNEGATSIGKGSNRVALRTLDSYRLDKVAMMKIDVEGFEYELLAGARATIARDHPILVIEIWPDNQARVLPVLEAAGYRVQKLGPSDFVALPAASP